MQVHTEQRTRAVWTPVAMHTAVAASICALIAVPGPPAVGAAAATPALAGQLVAIGSTRLTIRAQGGTSSIATAPTAAYYEATAGTARALAIGETVAISPRYGGTGKGAGTVAIAPSHSTLVAFVMQFGHAGAGGTGGAGAGNAGGPPAGGPPSGSTGGAGAGGPGGPGSDGDNDFGASRGSIGKITALSATSITIRANGGTKATLALDTSTKIFRLAPIARGQLRTGRFVAMRAGFVNGALAAKGVVEAPAGAVVVLGTALGG